MGWNPNDYEMVDVSVRTVGKWIKSTIRIPVRGVK